MYTYQMIAVADDNGRTYESEYGTYSKEEGFKFTNPPDTECKWVAFINLLMHEDIWKLKKEPVKKMSLADIEKELGYRVQIVDPKPKKKKLSNEEKKEIDDTIDFFNRLLGTKFKAEDWYDNWED